MNLIKFPSDTKYRKQFFTDLSFSHPAKMHLSLQLWLIDNFTKEGETILDPMAGSGTILVACSLGRNVITLELEDKFVQVQKGNWEKIQQRGCQLGFSMGTATILQGDARQLEGILCDKIITSPPYAGAVIGGPGGIDWTKATRGSKEEWKPRDRTRESAFNHLPGYALDWGYSRDPGNIGNLPYGSIDAVISSPPYEVGGQGVGTEHHPERMKGSLTGLGRGYTKDDRGKVDAVISSPPYENQIHRNSDEGKEKELMAIDPKHWYPNSQPVAAARYIPREDNIGNLKSDFYLSAMLQVYQQCHSVLKDGGLMVLVTKNFIHNKQQVRLDLDTIKLCEQAGFTFQDRWYRELQAQSFWRTIYHQKYPEVKPIKYEDVLVFKK